MLPTPLNLPQQGGNQRAPAILRFDRPRVSPDVFSSLQQSALLSSARRVTTREERVVLEAELRQRLQVTETGGTPGSPGTPDRFNTVTIREGSLDPRALNDLQQLLERFERGGRGGFGDSRLVRDLSETLEDFADRLGDNRADNVLGEIVARIERSVIGRDGLDFADLFRDPGLFLTIGVGLDRFGDETNGQAESALRDVILRIGNLENGRGNDRDDDDDDRRGNNGNGPVNAVAAAIDRLGRALEDEPNAVAALDRFLDRLQDRGTGGNPQPRYRDRIADILDDTLNNLRGGALDLQAVERLQAAVEQVRNLENVPGRRDDRLRARAVEGLEGILDRYATETTRSQTTRIPGAPAVPATPGERTLTVLEDVSLVPKVEIAERVAIIYQAVQESLRPLQKLSEPPPPVPNIKALVVTPKPEDDDETRKRLGAGAEEGRSGIRFGVQRPGEEEQDRFGTQPPRLNGGSGTGSIGQVFDSRV